MSQSLAVTVLFSAGEASGDQHAAHMFQEMKQLRPEIKGIGMGGKHMAAAGIDVRYDSAGMGVIGLVELFKHIPEGRRAFKLLQAIIVNEKPDLLVCVDYKEFNFRLAKFAKAQGVKVLFYVSPQVWASRPGRVKAYGKVIDMMAVIFPFETAIYEAEQIPVRYVGHPSVDKVIPRYSKAEALTHFNLNGQHKIIGLLPGSRRNEIERMLPVMLKAAALLQNKYPDAQFVLPQADSVSDALLAQFCQAATVKLNIIKQAPYDVMQCCDAIMTTSGTASLEIALLQIPMVIAYKLSPLTYFIGRMIVITPFIGLPNIIAGQLVVKELIQQTATPENLCDEIELLLSDQPYRQRCLKHLAEIKSRLGSGGASHKMALLALEMLG